MSEQPEMRPLTDAEQEWVRVRRTFAAQQGVDHLDLNAVETFYDQLYARAHAEEMDPPELEVLLDVVAVLLGEHLGARHGMQWVAVTDDSDAAGETNLALRDTLSSAVVFPQSVVGTEWNHESAAEWIPDYVDWLSAQLQDIRAEARREERQG